MFQNAVSADAHGDGLRARYQQEIEQLRALCEKGLLAMESSHRRIVREMEEKHRAEREQLRSVLRGDSTLCEKLAKGNSQSPHHQPTYVLLLYTSLS